MCGGGGRGGKGEGRSVDSGTTLVWKAAAVCEVGWGWAAVFRPVRGMPEALACWWEGLLFKQPLGAYLDFPAQHGHISFALHKASPVGQEQQQQQQ